MHGKIKFSVIRDNWKQTIEMQVGEYRNLMSLLVDKMSPDEFGVCGGMGRCGTCAVKIKGLSGTSMTKARNEPVTLTRLGHDDENIRLSCQIMISTDLEGAEIELLDCT